MKTPALFTLALLTFACSANPARVGKYSSDETGEDSKLETRPESAGGEQADQEAESSSERDEDTRATPTGGKSRFGARAAAKRGDGRAVQLLDRMGDRCFSDQRAGLLAHFGEGDELKILIACERAECGELNEDERTCMAPFLAKLRAWEVEQRVDVIKAFRRD